MRSCRPRDLFLIFLRIGAFTFGGGMAMIPLIRQALVEDRQMLSQESFLECIALTQCAPGPITGNLAVLLGYRLAGWPGAAAAVVGGVLPAFLVIVVIAAQYASWRDQTWANSMFAGLRPAILMLIAFAALHFTRSTIRSRTGAVVYAASLGGLVWLGLHPVAVIGGVLAFSLARWIIGRRTGNEVESCDLD